MTYAQFLERKLRQLENCALECTATTVISRMITVCKRTFHTFSLPFLLEIEGGKFILILISSLHRCKYRHFALKAYKTE